MGSLWLKCLIAKVLSASITFFLYSAKKAIMFWNVRFPIHKGGMFLIIYP